MKNEIELRNKILKGIQLAIAKLISASKENDGVLVISEKGKIIRVKARELK